MSAYALPSQKVHKAFRVRLRPSADQAAKINGFIGSARYVYNFFLQRRQEAYREQRVSLSYPDTSAELTVLKHGEETVWLRGCDKFALQNSLRDLDRAYQNFFEGLKKPPGERRSGYPRFHSKKGAKQSYRTNYSNGNIVVCNGFIKLPKLGLVEYRQSQKITGKIISVTVRRNPAGKYFASIQVETEVAALPESAESIGLDLGLRSYLVDSDGASVENPRYYKRALRQVRKAAKRVSRRVKGSRREGLARTKLALVHERVKNLRNDFLHKLSTSLIRRYGVICIEDLAVSEMARSRRVSQGVMDAGWGEFRRQLTYKSEWYGRDLMVVDRYFASSQLCSACGFQNPAVKDLAVRRWVCLGCGAAQDRDRNAAKNILKEGLRILGSQPVVAVGTPDTTPKKRSWTMCQTGPGSAATEEARIP